MDDTEEKAICDHCNKEVAKVNFPMHEAHCQRFLCLCPDCDEQVPKEQLEEHRLEQHTLVKCKQCNMKIERCKLADHEKDNCPKRLQICEFCQLEVPASSLKEHTLACGSRTERCQECNQYVILKDRLQHAQFCLAEDQINNYDKNTKPMPGNTLQQQKLVDFYYNQTDLDDDMREDFESEDTSLSLSALQKKKWSGKMDRADQDISTCSHCHLTLPIKTLQWHENKCRVFEMLKLKM
ncbi:XIAP-associated factor 1 [Trichomycterus rosablanca]|uniref:XIAP-associated factor 1 n=1 Tax=Trichomycterus rosablanca TaxID=2290929 RepID=UPI002F355EE1